MNAKKHPDVWVPESLEDELALELFRESQAILLDRLNKPLPFRFREERCLFRILDVEKISA